eukprot:COSAG05_NODE_2467_length_3028_cov_4.291909_4_plen_75_part_00
MKNKNEVTGDLLFGCTVLRITPELPWNNKCLKMCPVLSWNLSIIGIPTTSRILVHVGIPTAVVPVVTWSLDGGY